jgi:hypothetical protein
VTRNYENLGTYKIYTGDRAYGGGWGAKLKVTLEQATKAHRRVVIALLFL